MTQVLEDALEDTAIDFIRDYEQYDESTKRFLKKRAVDPTFDAKEKQRLENGLRAFLKS